MAEHGRKGTGWELVTGAAVLYLFARTLHLDFGSRWSWITLEEQGRRAPALQEKVRHRRHSLRVYVRAADWETEGRAMNHRVSGWPDAVWGWLTSIYKYSIIVGFNLGTPGTWGSLAPPARASGRVWTYHLLTPFFFCHVSIWWASWMKYGPTPKQESWRNIGLMD